MAAAASSMAVPPPQLEEIVEALRAVRDVDTNLHGIKGFRKQLRQHGPAFLRAYLQASPGFAELHRIWDHQWTVRRKGT